MNGGGHIGSGRGGGGAWSQHTPVPPYTPPLRHIQPPPPWNHFEGNRGEVFSLLSRRSGGGSKVTQGENEGPDASIWPCDMFREGRGGVTVALLGEVSITFPSIPLGAKQSFLSRSHCCQSTWSHPSSGETEEEGSERHNYQLGSLSALSGVEVEREVHMKSAGLKSEDDSILQRQEVSQRRGREQDDS